GVGERMDTVRIKSSIGMCMRRMRLNKTQTIEFGLIPLWVVIGVISIRTIAIFIGRIEDDFVSQQVSIGGDDLFYHVAWDRQQDNLTICQCFFWRTDRYLTPQLLT